MSDEQRGPEPSCLVTTFQYDPEGRLVSVEAPTPPGTKWNTTRPSGSSVTSRMARSPSFTTDSCDFSSSPPIPRPASRNR